MITKITALFLCLLTIVEADYLCNCYCPPDNTYVGYGIIETSSTICDTQICTDNCVGFTPNCELGSTWGECRNVGSSVTASFFSFALGLTATLAKKYL
ncbi:unnamed protein product [Adineta steineri]|uniref:Uncharacterized protein n=1 Tax=Adineta steineri TaxID=433720 RepID=A0A813Q5H7_9BILA|nr:unnamed protein product [Adineta steineri]CAF0797787.1 unnamed protein product [Adineta steineri]